MPLISTKCTSCGASLKVDSAKDAVTCQYCNSTFILKKPAANPSPPATPPANVHSSNPADFVFLGSVLEKYIGKSTDVVIPHGVTQIGNEAFSGCRTLINLTIPNSVKSIGSFSFTSCANLANVTFPNSLTSIGNSAFNGCPSLANITLPNNIISMGDFAFGNCGNLISAVLPKNITTIADHLFFCCSRLTGIDIPNGVTRIGNGAFYNCSGLMSITIPNSVVSVGGAAFLGCNGIAHIIEKYKREKWQRQWAAQGLCVNCGSKGGLVFAKKCRECSAPMP